VFILVELQATVAQIASESISLEGIDAAVA